MKFSQVFDLVETNTNGLPEDFSALPGTWLNSNPATNGIEKFVISEVDGELSLRVYGIGPDDDLIDWGSVTPAVVYASPTSRVAAGFTAVYDFGFVETRLQAMLAKGLCVLAIITKFTDQSGRADYFVREYFALSK